ncbi:MAG TPA: DNA repair protein RecN [Acidimicrobiales bacterium]|nr:DNA repair protein RecN [Acidimicrobiales bacterium]
MLEELRVRDLGVIDDVTVAFRPGMTALTGETGAGKTLLIEALGLLLGGRADPTLVRAGSAEATVEGRFGPGTGPHPDASLFDEDDPDDGEIILGRTLVAGGRSKAWINGRMAPVTTLATTGSALVELHGQHQHRSLVHTAAQRQALDEYGGIDLAELLAARSQLRVLTDESASLGGEVDQRAREMDVLRYQIDEIRAARIEDEGEDNRLELEEDRLAEAAAHREAAAAALEALAEATVGSALDRLAEASGALAGRPPLAALEARVRGAMAELSDLSTELRSVVDTWEDDPQRLEEIRSRRQSLRELQRKYGATLGQVVAFADDARRQLDAIESREARARQLDAEVTAARDVLRAEEGRVAALRRAAAPSLAAEIQSTLRTLAMPSARFEVSVEGAGPADQVSFLLGANPGEPLLPLTKVASGGELARTMLAVRLALTSAPGVLIFDEVDAGVGGSAATAVGAALAVLGRRSQVLVVTHLAQVAAQADHQLAVLKTEQGGRTRSKVAELGGEERVVELSRMLSGRPDSETARTHARELLSGIRGTGSTTGR